MVMLSNPFYSAQSRKAACVEILRRDEVFFAAVINDAIDYGMDLRFGLIGGAGTYTPHILATQPLDTPQKSTLFTQVFMDQCTNNAYPVKMCLNRLLPITAQSFTFLHEVMHFYQDMNGFYYAPLREVGVFPTMPDFRGRVMLTLFNEAWATCEAIRASYRIAQGGDDTPWRGALSSFDWGGLAREYAQNLEGGMEEARAAKTMFEAWYSLPQRIFYELEAMRFFYAQIGEYTQDGALPVAEDFRAVRISALMARVPHEGVLSYLHALDHTVLEGIKNHEAQQAVNDFEGEEYGRAQNINLQEVRCGSPPYLWKRIMEREIATSEIPPQH